MSDSPLGSNEIKTPKSLGSLSPCTASINAELYVIFIHSLSLSSLLILLGGPGYVMCLQDLWLINLVFFQSSWMVVDKVHLAVVKRTTGAGAATVLVPSGRNICGYATNSTGPHENALLGIPSWSDGLRHAQNSFIARIKSKARLQWAEAWVRE